MSEQHRAFALKPQYADEFSGASVAYGPYGFTIDLKQLVDAGDGTIVTDDPRFADLLAQHDLFDEQDSAPAGAEPVELPTLEKVTEAAQDAARSNPPADPTPDVRAQEQANDEASQPFDEDELAAAAQLAAAPDSSPNPPDPSPAPPTGERSTARRGRERS